MTHSTEEIEEKLIKYVGTGAVFDSSMASFFVRAGSSACCFVLLMCFE